MNTARLFYSVVTAYFLISFAISAYAQEWSRFRGENGAGIGRAKGIPSQWAKADFLWQVELPGEGASSPVLWGERLFVTSADEAAGKRTLSCLNAADGRTLWSREFPFASFKHHKFNTAASSTPVVDAQRVYVLWQSPEESFVAALNHAGEEQWRREFGKYHGNHGPGVSLMVVDGLLIVPNDDDQGSFWAALDCQTGEVRWKVSRDTRRATYSTPCVRQLPGKPAELIFTHDASGIAGVEPATGRTLWQRSVFGTFTQRAIGSPVLFEDIVIAASGFNTGEKNLVAVKPSKEKSTKEVVEVYRLSKTVPHIPTPLVHGQRLYLWTDNGIASCHHAATGEQLWQQRVGGNYYGSPVWCEGRLFNISTDGELVVLAAADEFAELGRSDLGEACRATLAVAEGRMYARTLGRLTCVSGTK